jgi:hypothetical protein
MLIAQVRIGLIIALAVFVPEIDSRLSSFNHDGLLEDVGVHPGKNGLIE